MINVMLTCMQLDRLGVLCPHKTPVVTERERVCVRSGHSWLSPFLLTSVYTAGGYWRRSAVQAARSQSGESDLRARLRGPGAGWQWPAVLWAGTWPSGSSPAVSWLPGSLLHLPCLEKQTLVRTTSARLHCPEGHSYPSSTSSEGDHSAFNHTSFQQRLIEL